VLVAGLGAGLPAVLGAVLGAVLPVPVLPDGAGRRVRARARPARPEVTRAGAWLPELDGPGGS
jgi:hypothetical protein